MILTAVEQPSSVTDVQQNFSDHLTTLLRFMSFRDPIKRDPHPNHRTISACGQTGVYGVNSVPVRLLRHCVDQYQSEYKPPYHRAKEWNGEYRPRPFRRVGAHRAVVGKAGHINFHVRHQVYIYDAIYSCVFRLLPNPSGNVLRFAVDN